MKSEDYFDRLHSLLFRLGIPRPKLFTHIKACGGTQGNGDFVGWIPFVFIDNKPAIVVVPYKRKHNVEQVQKTVDDDHFGTILYEAEQELGIIPTTDNFKLVYQRELDNIYAPEHKHQQYIYVSEVVLNDLFGKLKFFRGYNSEDPEKGKPVLVLVEEVYEFLPTAHLAGVSGLIQYLEKDYLNLRYLSSQKTDMNQVRNNCRDLNELLANALRQRLRPIEKQLETGALN